MYSPFIGASTVVVHSSWVSRSMSHNLRLSLSNITTYFGLIIKTETSYKYLLFICFLNRVFPCVSVWRRNTRHYLIYWTNILNVLLSSSFLQKEHKRITEGSEHRGNLYVLLSKTDWDHFLLKHRLSIIWTHKTIPFIVPNQNTHQQMQKKWISVLTIYYDWDSTVKYRLYLDHIHITFTYRSFSDSSRLIKHYLSESVKEK